MVGTSNERIMSEYLIKYGLAKTSGRGRPTDLLETLYISERYQAGDDLALARAKYDHSVWNGVRSAEVNRRLGSRLIDQSQKMTVAASAIAEKKTVGHRS